jgi:hypothetical protein
MILLFSIWTVYTFLGIIWLAYISEKDYIEEYNLIGSIIIVLFWPIHLIYTKFKNGIF